MSDIVFTYKGFKIARNEIGYRILHISYSPIFSSFKKARDYILFISLL